MLEQRPGPDFIVFSNHYFRGYPRRQNVNVSNSGCCQLSMFYSKQIDAALTKLYDILLLHMIMIIYFQSSFLKDSFKTIWLKVSFAIK